MVQLVNAVKRQAFALRCAVSGGSIRSSYGPRLRVQPQDDTFFFSATGLYGTMIPALLANKDRPFVFLDVGANQGIFSLVASSAPLCRQVVSVEAVPWTFGKLVANIQLNHATKITPIFGAIADTTAPAVRLSYSENHSGASRISDQGVWSPVVAPELLDVLLSEHDHPIVLKIDVEGMEYPVLQSLMRSSSFARVTDIVVEMSAAHSGAAALSSLQSVLIDEGFNEKARSSDNTEHYDAHFGR